MYVRKALFTFVFSLIALCSYADKVYDIWPVPQQQVRVDGTATLTDEVVVIAGKGCDSYTLDRANQVLTEHHMKVVMSNKPRKGVATLYLGIHGSGDKADKIGAALGLKRDVFAKPKYDRHILSVRQTKDGAVISIIGENTNAVFCGLASLEQMLDKGTKALSCVDIYDYADIRDRGIIEGYYGVPYSKEVTADLFRFMARYKMNTYMYGAKSDPYHSQYWDKAYPETLTAEQKRVGMMTSGMLKELTDVAHATKVNFIWAIHPGVAFTDTKQDDVLNRIMDKFQLMHDLGVRQFGVFVDDVGVPSDSLELKVAADRLTELQHRVDARWNGKGMPAKDTVKALNYVPQLYAYSWVSDAKAATFFRSLKDTPKKTNIYITGKAVWTVPNSSDPAKVSKWLGRDVAWWWNYPCNDNDMTKIFPLDMYRNFRDEKWIDNDATLEPHLQGVNTLICNPMQQGEISKIGLFSAADYSWNRAAFDNDASWMASLNKIFGDKAADAFRLLPYLSYFDESTRLADLIRLYKQSPGDVTRANDVKSELQMIVTSAKRMATMEQSEHEADRLMWEELKPFVYKVSDMAVLAGKLLDARAQNHADASIPTTLTNEEVAMDKNERYTFDMLSGMGEDIKLEKSNAQPSQKVLRTFIAKLAAK